MSQGTGIAGGAALGSLVGPGGAAIGGVAGYYGGDAVADTMGADPQVTLSQAREILRNGDVYVPPPWYMRWQVWLASYLAFRFRRGLFAIVTNAATGGFGAAAMSTLGTLVGGRLSDKAKAATVAHVDARRRKKPPVTNPLGPTLGDAYVGKHPKETA